MSNYHNNSDTYVELSNLQITIDRLVEKGCDALSDRELLELTLSRSIPHRDVESLARKLLYRFGTFSEIVGAAPARLAEVGGVCQTVVSDLKMIEAFTRRFLKGEIRQRQTMECWSLVIDYCRAAMAFSEVEQFRVLFLDKRNCLISDEVQSRGTIDHTPVYPRDIIKRALELSAISIVLVHNHPSGNPAPSRSDIEMTERITYMARDFGIGVQDHLIIGRDGHASLREMGLIKTRQ